MSSIDELTTALSGTRVSESGVSFAGKSLKLNTEEDAKEVTTEINNSNNLQYLNLEGNTLGVEAAAAIGKALEKHPEFKRALWKDMFTGRMKTEIPKALEFLGDGLVKSGCRLRELDMSDNAFGPIGVEGLASLLRSPSCYALEELRLKNNGLGITGCKLLTSALKDCYNRSKAQGKPLSLRVFTAGRNRLENEGAKALSELFKMFGTLEVLEIPQNGIYHEGIASLSEALCCNKNLEILNLNDNTIGPKGAKALAKTLPYLQNLRQINFGDCLLKTEGAIVLAQAITDKHEKLEELIMDSNEISKKGGVAIVKALHNKAVLKNIMLDSNAFGEEGIEEIRKELQKIGKLNTLGSLDEDEGETDEDESASGESEEEVELITIEEFLSEPNEENFMKLGDERRNVIIKEAQKNGDIILNDYVEIIMKVSSLYGSKNEMVRNFSLDVTEGLYKALFTWAFLKGNSPYVFNVIFVNLGLIKCEDKTFKPKWNCINCQNALRALKNSDSVPETVRNILDVFFAHLENGVGKS